MSDIHIPSTKAEAEELLLKFPSRAFDAKYKENFLKAATICYGPYYSIIVDTTNRMCFYCTICCKEANSIKAISDHSYSGSHLKNVNLQQMRKPLSEQQLPTSHSFHPNSLQYMLQNSNATIVGLNMVNSFEDGISSLYYKCNLCGTHATADAMLRHLTGNRHCDKYINARVKMENIASMTNEDRECLKNVINEVDNCNLHCIMHIKGSTYFPYVWKHIVINAKQQRQKIKGKHDDLKKQLKTLNIETTPLVLSTKMEDSIKTSTGYQIMTTGYLDEILGCLKFITVANESSVCRQVIDMKQIFKILIATLHYQYYTMKTMITCNLDTTPEVEYQKRELRLCLGYVMKYMLNHIRQNYISIDLK